MQDRGKAMKPKILILAVLLVPALGWGQVSDVDRRFIETVKALTRLGQRLTGLEQNDKEHQKNFVNLVAVIESLEKRLDALERRGR
jgi:hypothetical protein